MYTCFIKVFHTCTVNSHHNKTTHVESKLESKINATLLCTSATNVGSNLKLAFGRYCKTSDFDLWHAWDNTKTNAFLNMFKDGEYCHSYRKVIEWIYSDYSADICILKNIYWIDQNLDILRSNIYRDIMEFSSDYTLVSIHYCEY